MFAEKHLGHTNGRVALVDHAADGAHPLADRALAEDGLHLLLQASLQNTHHDRGVGLVHEGEDERLAVSLGHSFVVLLREKQRQRSDIRVQGICKAAVALIEVQEVESVRHA